MIPKDNFLVGVHARQLLPLRPKRFYTSGHNIHACLFKKNINVGTLYNKVCELTITLYVNFVDRKYLLFFFLILERKIFSVLIIRGK